MRDTRNLSPAGRRMVAAALPENREARRESAAAAESEVLAELTTTTAALMRGPDGRSQSVELMDGFLRVREVRATEPWRPSRVRLGERPRVEHARRHATCGVCGAEYIARRSTSTVCGATCRQRRQRERRAGVAAVSR